MASAHMVATDLLPAVDVVKADPSDNVYLATALAGGARWVVTGNTRHLTPLDGYAGLRIVEAGRLPGAVGRSEINALPSAARASSAAAARGMSPRVDAWWMACSTRSGATPAAMQSASVRRGPVTGTSPTQAPSSFATSPWCSTTPAGTRSQSSLGCEWSLARIQSPRPYRPPKLLGRRGRRPPSQSARTASSFAASTNRRSGGERCARLGK